MGLFQANTHLAAWESFLCSALVPYALHLTLAFSGAFFNRVKDKVFIRTVYRRGLCEGDGGAFTDVLILGLAAYSFLDNIFGVNIAVEELNEGKHIYLLLLRNFVLSMMGEVYNASNFAGA